MGREGTMKLFSISVLNQHLGQGSNYPSWFAVTSPPTHYLILAEDEDEAVAKLRTGLGYTNGSCIVSRVVNP